VYGPMWSDSGPAYSRSLSVSTPKARKGHAEASRGFPGRPPDGLSPGVARRILFLLSGVRARNRCMCWGHFCFHL